jgi:hypothetical protein
MSQEQRVFYLHEDDWGMVSLVPHENLAFLHEERDRIDAFSAAHFDGVAWTDISVRSEEPSPIALRAIPYTRLTELFGSLLPAADRFETGYSSYREPCPGCFAFGKPYDFALYGSIKDGIVTGLSLSMQLPPADTALSQALAVALVALGAEYQLVLVDWARSKIVNLSDPAAVARYLSDDEEDA